MGKIKQLDELTTNMIAAGEVVERPMGVVKELVENAIDAGSTRIIVSVEEGGMQKITVSDNGTGMDADDAQMCFQRHATSKIRNKNDLWAINTLGFRGEALPSIAAVAKVTLTTGDGEDGTRVVMAYGKKESASSYPCNQGTEISVEGLFYHTPARLKHMRSASYEASLIQDVITRFALSHPEIAFELIHDGRDVFRTGGQGSLLEVVYNAFGQSAAENAMEVHFEDLDYTVEGYIVKPFITRASRNMMFLFLNGRMVKTYKLYKAVQDGYRGFIPEGRYPVCVLHIEMDPHLLDVNVHPSKWEVRISKEIQLEVLLKEEIAKALQDKEIIPQVEPVQIQTTYYQPLAMEFDEPVPKKEPEPEIQIRDVVQEQQEDIQILQKIAEQIKEPEEEEETPVFPTMEVIGQFHDKYILASTEEGLVLIDQNAARKRILYEQTLQKLDQAVIKEELLVPAAVHTSDDICSRIEEINAITETIGITFESFGHDTLLVRAIPAWLKQLDEVQFLNDLLDDMKEDRMVHGTKALKEKAASLAVNRVYSRREHLSLQECAEVIEQLSECHNPFMSLKGKPIYVIFDEKEMTKEFGR